MVATPESNIVLSNQEFNVVGTRPIRHDGAEKVTGRARYSADINLPGMLYAKVLRSPHAHARIKNIDTSKAEAMSGVRAVVTSAALPQPTGVLTDIGEGAMLNPKFLSNNCLATDKALYKGHAVAAVAATSAHIAEQALALIAVDYEVLPYVTDILDAMKDDAPVLHERLANMTSTNVRSGGLRDEADGTQSTNIANHFFFEMGDIEQGFKDADVIVEREFRTSSVHQGYIEPHAATADWGPDGNLTIWCSSQGHFNVRDQVASTLGIDVSNIKVVPMEIGGGFGGKTLVYLEPVAALLSRKAGQPVKLSMSRSEVFQGSGPTSGSWMKCKLGATKDGRITAIDASLAYEAGAYPGSPINPGCQCMCGPYNIANGRIEGFDVVLNKPKTAAYRAPGAPIAAFAMETVVDEVCAKIGMDPLEFRVLNASKEGT
ncbi:MAG: xanthine dehydrogenase family protein molybdopterin-binding subunit, partial [Dehalococcoidia bacterium]